MIQDPPIDPRIALLRAQRRQRLIITMAVIPFVISMSIFLAGESLQTYLYFAFGIARVLPAIAAAILAALSGFGFLMLYLQTGFKKVDLTQELLLAEDVSDLRRTKQQSSVSRELSELRTEFQAVKTAFEQSKAASVLTDDQRRELMNTLKNQLLTDKTNEVLAEFRDRIEATVTQDERRKSIALIFRLTFDRLNLEVRALGRRGNTNLAIGIFTTLSGLVILGELVFRANFDPKDTLALSAHYIPRITLVIFIEIFAYFFLKLYKASLSEIKYFQNEMTNAEAKYAALVIGLEEENKTARSDILKSLAHTERNSVLKKGESTVELERVKLDKDAIVEVLPKLLGAFKTQAK